MNNPLARTRGVEHGHAPGFHLLVRFTAYSFLVQGVIFALIIVLLVSNLQFFQPHTSVDWPEFLTQLHAAPTQFLVIKALMLALRTLYGISMVGVALVWWHRNRSAAALVISFIVVSIPVINTSQLMGMVLVPLAGDYTAAAALNETTTMISIEVTARALYTNAEYLDAFVNVVPFVGLLACLFWLSTRVAGLERIKWILPLLIILPFNKFLDLPPFAQLGASLLNVVATGAYFFLMGWFLLRSQPQESVQRH
jgi:hypothetical protein